MAAAFASSSGIAGPITTLPCDSMESGSSNAVFRTWPPLPMFWSRVTSQNRFDPSVALASMR
jgi:hypothetical protein